MTIVRQRRKQLKVKNQYLRSHHFQYSYSRKQTLKSQRNSNFQINKDFGKKLLWPRIVLCNDIKVYRHWKEFALQDQWPASTLVLFWIRILFKCLQLQRKTWLNIVGRTAIQYMKHTPYVSVFWADAFKIQNNTCSITSKE